MNRLLAAARLGESGWPLAVLTAAVVLLPFVGQATPLTGVIDAELGYLAALALFAWGLTGGWSRATAAVSRGRPLRVGGLVAVGLGLVFYLDILGTAMTAWVRACIPDRGPWVFLLMVAPAPLLGLACGAVARAWARTRLRALLILGGLVLVLVVAPTLVRAAFLQRAPHNVLFGAWGLVTVFGYRAFDLLTRPSTLIYRAGAVALAALLLALAEAGLRRRLGRTASPRERRALIGSALLVVLLLAGGAHTGSGLGRSAMAAHLSGAMTSGPVTIRFDPSHLEPLAARRLLDDAAFHHEDLAGRLELTPEEQARPVVVWGFAAREMSRGSVGLSYGNVAAPWLGETVVTVAEDGTSVTLRHELVHLLAAPWKGPPFYAPVDSTRTEGLARALELGRDRGGVHQRTFAAALEEGRLPGVGSFLGFRNFWLGGQNVRNAYDLAGSFVGFLIETQGVDRVRRWYAGATEVEAFGLTVERLDQAWRERLREVEVATTDRRAARRQFGEAARPATHARRCVRLRAADRGAEQQERMREALREEDWDALLRMARADETGDEAVDPFERRWRERTRASMEFAALTGLGRHAEAAAGAAAALGRRDEADPDYPYFLDLSLRGWLAAGDDAGARGALDRIEALASPGIDLRLWLRAALDSPLREAAVDVFLEQDSGRKVERALALLDEEVTLPGFGLWALGWLDASRGFGPRAHALAERLLDDDLPDAVRGRVHARLGRAAEDEGRLAAALRHARAALELEQDELVGARLGDRIERLEWRSRRARAQPLPSSS